MGYLGRRIGKSADTGNPTADGTGAGILDLFTNGYFQRQGNIFNAPGDAPFSASGGDVDGLAPGNGYKYHTFTTPGPSTFVISSSITVDILMVGGGGSGGGFGGGGGAGGLIYYPNAPLTSGTYPISIGAGGGISPQVPGSDTTFGTNPSPQYLVAKGGGKGSSAGIAADVGGSGGGASRDPTTGANANQSSQPGNSGTYGYGTSGGNSQYVGGGDTRGGGGGGAGASGNPGNSSDGKGGAGRQYPEFTGPLIGVPSLAPLNGYFAGGGGGGREPAPSPATGGLGGGGNGGKGPGSATGTGSPGVTNSGGGGGGGGSIEGLGYPGGSGGSGIVIIRYLA